ncbi:hypothetical protein FNV43_RR08134 [Rhamnella rubrinervis]|uniref:Uncharacterized protein n=1 Tax=Rhamnella rubrinervis TaxID=2594499 RepID=A0A8K0HI05_9ROSA|nr:hypothetical protein FNV43_RR08134 [Rhamnella rubrinervis]
MIFSCISLVEYQLLVNGGSRGWIIPRKGDKNAMQLVTGHRTIRSPPPKLLATDEVTIAHWIPANFMAKGHVTGADPLAEQQRFTYEWI